jgi:hypothetical protein
VKKILDIKFRAGQREIKKIYSGLKFGLTLPRPSEATFLLQHAFFPSFCVNISLFG